MCLLTMVMAWRAEAIFGALTAAPDPARSPLMMKAPVEFIVTSSLKTGVVAKNVSAIP